MSTLFSFVVEQHTNTYQGRNTKMVLLRFTCLVLGLLFTLLALKDCVAHAHLVTTTAAEVGNGLAATGVNVVSVNKELFKGVPAPAAASARKRLGGRKMVVDNVLREETKKEEGLNGGTPKISGKDMNASKKSLATSQKNMNDQKNSERLKSKALNYGRKEILGSEPVDLPKARQLNSQDSVAISTCGSLECSSISRKSASPDYHDPFRKIESQKLLEAANEIVSMIHKDYSGMNRPRRKPPINNHEPLDGEDVKP